MKGRVLVIGGTGAMGGPVVRRLLSTSQCGVRVLTRDLDSSRVAALRDLGGARIEVVRGDLDDEDSLLGAMKSVDAVFCNTDFWSTASAVREYEQGRRALETA